MCTQFFPTQIYHTFKEVQQCVQRYVHINNAVIKINQSNLSNECSVTDDILVSFRMELIHVKSFVEP